MMVPVLMPFLILSVAKNLIVFVRSWFMIGDLFITSLNLTSVTFQISDEIKQNETCFIQIQVFKNNDN